MNASDKLIKARAGLVLDMPFFGALSLRLQTKEDQSCPTAYTDGRLLGYNPKFVDGLTLAEAKGLWAHEVMHNGLAHTTRRGARDAKKWNVACDYAINGILVDSKVMLPPGGLVDRAYDNLSAEEIYTRLPDGAGGRGGSKNDSSDPGGCGEVRDATDADGNKAGEAEMERVAADWKIATQQAAQSAKAMGALPAELERLVEEIVAAKIDWRETLRRFITAAAHDDYRWSPPNRRHAHAGIYLPSLHSEKMQSVVVAVDTSGSIGAADLAQFSGELTAILEDCGADCHVVYCDASVQGAEDFTRDDLPITLNALGGGGTDFVPVFEHVAARAEQPACLVYLTDMYGHFPQAEPSYPVLWVSTSGVDQAPFGEVVKL